MRKLLAFLLLLISVMAVAQDGPGIGFYPTGTESGLGFRFSKQKRFTGELRLSRALYNSDRIRASSAVCEASAIFRPYLEERLRLHVGLGGRMESDLKGANRYGFVIPCGVEAFPFPFQNAGLFFETGIYFVAASDLNYTSGLRTAGGILFYFTRKK